MDTRTPSLTVARTHLAIVAFVIAAGLVAGVRMQLELWQTGVRWDADHYNTMIGVHGLLALAVTAPALAGCCGYLMVDASSAARRAFVPALAWTALAAFVIGLCAAVAAHASADASAWTFYAPERAVDDTAALASLSSLSFAAAGLLHAGQLGLVLVRVARETTLASLVPSGAFVVAVATASVLTAVAAIEPGSVDDARIALATKVAAVSLAVAAFASRWRAALPFVCAGVLPALVFQQVSGTLVFADDLFVHDTHVVVGQTHAQGAAYLFAALAALHAWRESLTTREPRAWLLWLGTLATSAGMLVHAYASIRNGASGMPRRYMDYLPDFVANHQLATKGAIAAVVGVVLLAAAWLTARSRTSTS